MTFEKYTRKNQIFTNGIIEDGLKLVVFLQINILPKPEIHFFCFDFVRGYDHKHYLVIIIIYLNTQCQIYQF